MQHVSCNRRGRCSPVFTLRQSCHDYVMAAYLPRV
jgi:hypothetical protein